MSIKFTNSVDNVCWSFKWKVLKSGSNVDTNTEMQVYLIDESLIGWKITTGHHISHILRLVWKGRKNWWSKKCDIQNEILKVKT